MSPLGSYLRSIVCHQRDGRITIPTQRASGRKTSSATDIPYSWSPCLPPPSDDRLSIIQLTHFTHSSQRDLFFFLLVLCCFLSLSLFDFFESLFRKWASSECAWPTRGRAKDGEGQERRRSSGLKAVLRSALMHCFLLVISHSETHLVTPTPLSALPERQLDLLCVCVACVRVRVACPLLRVNL